MTAWIGNIAKIIVPTPFTVGDVNLYLIKGDQLTLVDAGVKTKAAWEAFQFQLSQLRLTPDDIEQVVLTHHHPDHVGLLDWLPDKVFIYGHRYVVPWLARDKAFFHHHDAFYTQLYTEFGVKGDMLKMLHALKKPLKLLASRPLTNVIQAGSIIPGLADWQVLETPGHAQSHLCFYREKDRTLLAGDHLLATISSNPILEPSLQEGEERPRPQLQYRTSLKKLFSYDIDVAFTGHGEEISEVHALVEQRLIKQQDRALQVREMLKSQTMTVFSICKQLFPTIYQRELGLTLSETTAQLDYLLAHGAIEKYVDDAGVAYFTAK